MGVVKWLLRVRSALVDFIGLLLPCCVSVKSHLTSGESVRPENAVTYSADNEGQNICGVFFETAPLQSPFLRWP